MEIIYSLIHYLPFWAVPVLLLSIEFALSYHMKGFRLPVIILSIVSFFCLVLLIIYFMSGSPDEAVRFFKLIFDDLSGHSSR